MTEAENERAAVSEMIERVAKAMHHAEAEPHKEQTGYGDVWGWEDAMPAVQERHREAARAAIEAMREPTDAMARGAQATGMGLVTPAARKEMFTAMIDAALSPSGEGL